MIDSPLLPLRQNDERESRDPAGGGFPGLQKTPEMFPFRAFSKAILPFAAEGSYCRSSECRGAIDRWQKNRQLLFGRNYPQPSAFNPFLKELCNALGILQSENGDSAGKLGCIIRYHGDILLRGVGKPLSAGFAVDANPWDLLLLVASTRIKSTS